MDLSWPDVVALVVALVLAPLAAVMRAYLARTLGVPDMPPASGEVSPGRGKIGADSDAPPG